MRRFMAAGSICVISASAALAEAPLPTGQWRVQDGTAAIRVVNCAGALWGVIAGAIGGASNTDTDKNNPDPALRNRPVLVPAFRFLLAVAAFDFRKHVLPPLVANSRRCLFDSQGRVPWVGSPPHCAECEFQLFCSACAASAAPDSSAMTALRRSRFFFSSPALSHGFSACSLRPGIPFSALAASRRRRSALSLNRRASSLSRIASTPARIPPAEILPVASSTVYPAIVRPAELTAAKSAIFAS